MTTIVLSFYHGFTVVIIIILHKLLKFFVYVHFQFGYSALSSARFKYLPEVERLLVKYGAKQVCLN